MRATQWWNLVLLNSEIWWNLEGQEALVWGSSRGQRSSGWAEVTRRGRKGPHSHREQSVGSTRSMRECDEDARWSQRGWSPGSKVQGKTCMGDHAQKFGSYSSCGGKLCRDDIIWRMSWHLEVGPACSLEDILSHPWQDLCHQELPPGLPWWRSGWESACQCREHRF